MTKRYSTKSNKRKTLNIVKRNTTSEHIILNSRPYSIISEADTKHLSIDIGTIR